MQEGEENPGGTLFVVKKGEAAVYTNKDGTFKRPMALLKIGDIFGEYSALSNSPCTATVAAKTELEVFTLERNSFLEIIKRNAVVSDLLKEIGESRMDDAVIQMPYFQLIQDLADS